MAIVLNKEDYGIFPAGQADLERYQAVAIVAGKVVDPAAGGRVAGIVDLDAPKEDQATQIQVRGIAKVKCSGVINQDDEVTVDADGLVSAVAATGEYVLGQALEAGVAGQIIEVYLIKDLRAA